MIIIKWCNRVMLNSKANKINSILETKIRDTSIILKINPSQLRQCGLIHHRQTNTDLVNIERALKRKFHLASRWKQIALYSSKNQHRRVQLKDLNQAKLIRVLVPLAWPRTRTYPSTITKKSKMSSNRYKMLHLSLNSTQSSWKVILVRSKPKSKTIQLTFTVSLLNRKLQQENWMTKLKNSPGMILSRKTHLQQVIAQHAIKTRKV